MRPCGARKRPLLRPFPGAITRQLGVVAAVLRPISEVGHWKLAAGDSRGAQHADGVRPSPALPCGRWYRGLNTAPSSRRLNSRRVAPGSSLTGRRVLMAAPANRPDNLLATLDGLLDQAIRVVPRRAEFSTAIAAMHDGRYD